MIENVHKEFLRKLTGARKSTPLYMLYGELGRYPLEIKQERVWQKGECLTKRECLAKLGAFGKKGNV